MSVTSYDRFQGFEWMHSKHGLQVEVRADDEADPQDPQVRELLFQGVRELLLNVANHSGVNQAVIELTRTDNAQVRVSVSDQGVGFDPQKYRSEVLATNAFGLFNIQERLELLGGRVEIARAPGHGTRVTLLAPAG